MKQNISAEEMAELLVRFTVDEPPHRETIMSSLYGLSEAQLAKIREEIIFLDIVVFANLMGTAKVKKYWKCSEDVFTEYSAKLANIIVSGGHDHLTFANTVGDREEAYRKAIWKPLKEARYAVADTFEALCGLKDELSVDVAGMGEFVSAVNYVGDLLTRYEVVPGPTGSASGAATTERAKELKQTVRQAAERGDASAQFKLGEMCRRGDGVPRDDVEAVSWYRKAAEQGDAKAQADLGFMYDRGLGVQQDDAEAVRWYREAAEQGWAYGQANLGVMFATGRGMRRDDAEAVRWYRKAAEQGWASAQTNLGRMYEQGRGVPQDECEAVCWYRKAAEQGDADAQAKIDALDHDDQGVPEEDAQISLGFMDDQGRGVLQDDSETVCSCRKAAEQGEAHAQLELARMYEEGRGVPQDDAEALRWYRKAAEQGYEHAQFCLGAMYAEGRGVARDYVEAVRWYRMAAEQGNANAQFVLGDKYRFGDGVPQDDGEAVRWYRKAAKQGNAKAQANLGFMHERGRGAPHDDFAAVLWYLKAAEQGWAYAQANLADMYAAGRGVQRDDAKAVRWYRKAAEQGWARAQASLGDMYAGGRGVAQDYVEAVRWYRMAAEQGDSDAQYNLGCLYANGEGVPQDHAEAAQWYHKAAEQGYATAQFSLGVMYDDGKGVAHDEIEALRWYRMAAEQGNASAQFALGRMYEDGCGVAQDDAEAIRWYRLAAEHGLASAQTRLASAQTRLAAMFLDRRPQGPELNRLKPPSALRDVLARARRTGVSIVAKIKGVGMGAVGVLACVIAIALPFILLFGMTWVSVKLLPWLRPVIFWTLVVCVFLLGPTALFRRTRGFSAAGLMWASYIFGAVLWIWSLLVTLDLWGILAAVIGLLIMGVGIVPVAILAAIFHAQWAVLGDIAIGLVVTFGARVLALWLASKAERDDKETYIETREHTLNRMQELLSGRGLQICTAALLFVALANWPYGYYSFLRLAVCAAASVLAWRASKAGRPLWTLVMAGIALLFNPIIPVRFHRAEWAWIDAVAASVFLALPPVKKRQKGSA